jgi:hypothetical protein
MNFGFIPPNPAALSTPVQHKLNSRPFPQMELKNWLMQNHDDARFQHELPQIARAHRQPIQLQTNALKLLTNFSSGEVAAWANII